MGDANADGVEPGVVAGAPQPATRNAAISATRLRLHTRSIVGSAAEGDELERETRLELATFTLGR
jgi:hypothetical protein